MNSVRHFSDSDSLDSLPQSVLGELEQHIPVKRNAARIDFVGIVWADERPCIFWPKGMSDAARHVTPPKLLIDVLRRAGKSKRLQHTLRGIGGQIEFPVELEILENYLEHGLYETRETRFTRSQSGKVDWRRTVQGQVPSFGKNNVPIYLEPISPCQSSADHLIRQIHSYVVGVCDRSFAWLLTLSGAPVAQVHHNKRLPVTINQAVAMVRRELYGEFNDVRKNQLRLLLRFFRKQGSDRPSSSGLIGTDFFHVVWEEMCGVYFGSQNSSVGYPATPSYFYDSRGSILEPSRQGRPDILLEDQKCLAIVDAKYYDLRATKPSWSDLVKQFFYAKAFAHRSKYQSINNAFAVPAAEGAVPTSASVIDPELDMALDKEFPPIRIIYIDVVEIMSHYCASRVNTEMRGLALGGT
jgi:hypothetical protein